jgi:hypothetical protein
MAVSWSKGTQAGCLNKAYRILENLFVDLSAKRLDKFPVNPVEHPPLKPLKS